MELLGVVTNEALGEVGLEGRSKRRLFDLPHGGAW